MPPQIRTRATKALKENIDIENRRPKGVKKTKTVRKALADKTNSLSDDNESIEVPRKTQKNLNIITEKKAAKPDKVIEKVRPHRQRRLPNRYVENHVLNNLSNSKDNIDIEVPKSVKDSQTSVIHKDKKQFKQTNKVTPPSKKPSERNKILSSKHGDVKIKEKETISFETPKKTLSSKPEVNGLLCVNTLSSFKTPLKNLDCSLVVNRPKRVCRLPSRFEDHSISPSKFVPVQPCHASTPIVPIKSKPTENVQRNIKKPNNTQNNPQFVEKAFINATDKKPTKKPVEHSKSSKKLSQKKLDEYMKEKVSPDTNNNPKQTRSVRNKNLIAKKISPVLETGIKRGGRLINKSDSFKILEDKDRPKNIDIYEFTFDPNEEPTPKKKKRKRIVKKKPAQPKKQFVYKNNYDKNVSKALAALKTVVSKKPVESQAAVINKPKQANVVLSNSKLTTQVTEITSKLNKVQQTKDIEIPPKPSLSGAVNNSVAIQNYSPVYEDNIDFDHTGIDINYSPINTAAKTPDNITQVETQEQVHNDPLNLQDDLSFFDDQPVASSSVNVSKHPLASPWRVEFENLPIKWHVNSYVKSNMTPAVESSFINSNENLKKKHVYTNMVPVNNESLPEIVDKESNLKQTSIISFIKEVAEKQARKKLHKSPRKVNSLFEDITNTTNYDMYTPKKTGINISNNTNSSGKNTDSSINASNEKENSKENRKRKNNDELNAVPAKSPRKQKDKDSIYFGFDETDEQNENTSPLKNKKNRNVRSLRPRSRAVLQEINGQIGPTRLIIPVAAKSNIMLGSEAVNKVYDDLKSATDAPIFKQQNVNNIETTNIDQSLVNEDDESQSVHLFEDIDVVHHLKPTRKSYGKAKKVTFRQRVLSDSDSGSDKVAEAGQASSDEDDLADLSFHIPTVVEKKITKKKPTKKKLMSKKEEKEAEAWAAGFNSMCEDIEEFPLLVE